MKDSAKDSERTSGLRWTREYTKERGDSNAQNQVSHLFNIK